jgi:DMSO/TMAO reductase YedYZ molybdopterin-dependent catalytic subunit
MERNEQKLTAQQEVERRARRSFLALGAGAVAGAAGLTALFSGAEEGDIPPGLRKILGFNESVVRSALYSKDHLVKTYAASEIGDQKVNADIGIDTPLDAAAWRLEVVPFGASAPSASLTLDDLKALPRTEEIIDFKCVEGWSAVSQFAGVRLADFTAKFAASSAKAPCVGMWTPDQEYYVSIDGDSALHPQTLLAWEMNGKPLTEGHGAPLRLVIPVKYGIKNIKRIGRIAYTEKATPDYWAERGYDWYAGL